MLNVENRKANAEVAIAAIAMFGVAICGNLAVGQPARTQPDEKQVSDYIGKLGDPNPRVREKGADMLGIIGLRIKDETILLPAVKRLVPLMGDDDMEVRDETAEALGVIASRVKDEAAVKSAIAALIKGLADRDEEVREESAEALARIASTITKKALLEPAVGPLRKALADGAADTREFARHALESLGKSEAKATGAMKLSTKDLSRDRYLLLDSRIIESADNAKLTVGAVRKDRNNPLFKEDKPWEPRFDNPYVSVIYDQEDKIYKCWYSVFIQASQESWIKVPRDKRAWVDWTESRDRRSGVCYATSKDGIHWEKPTLGIIEFQGSRKNNMVLRAAHGVGVIKDLHETDPRKRYKAIHPHRGHTDVWFSSDGLNWAQKRRPGLDHGDTYNCVFWDPALKKYLLFTRNWGGRGAKGKRYGGGKYRRESRSVSPDFLNWSKAKVVIEGLDTDMQIHDMPVFRHAGVYIGLVGLFDTIASRQHVELAWSPDSVRWHRICPGTPLIANSRHVGECDWGCIFASPPIFGKDEIRLYYGGCNGRFMGWRDGFFCLARLRPDGFAGYEQVAGGSNKTATVTTKPVIAVADSLRVTADMAMSGYVKVTLLGQDSTPLAEGELITRTGTDAEVRWKGDFSLGGLKSKQIRLRFELRDSKLYSFSFHQ